MADAELLAGLGEEPAEGAEAVIRVRRSSTTMSSHTRGVRWGLRCGRDDRSRRVGSSRHRVSHLWAVTRLMPAARAAALTLQCCSVTRATRRARLAGQVRAPLWRSIRGSSGSFVGRPEHLQLPTPGPRLNRPYL